ncbi:hypothetical protein [Pseudomonas sp. CGJS7]|uniref:hypothetical protein n=1 Tax=Pseudomonas sp. CGJS7 TaxID=3109348 RepID=UPI00300B05C4
MSSLLSPAELAWYVTGRFYRRSDGYLADYGYFLHLSGIAGDLFVDGPAEGRAHFTFAAKPFKARAASNGALDLALDPAGEFSVYLQRIPAGDFDHPETFAQGERIATFRRTGLVVGTTVSAQVGGAAAVPVLGNNVFSAQLIDSRHFEFAGAHYDLGAILGRGVTQFGTSAAVPVAFPAHRTHPPTYELVLPFTGSAIALGR